MVATSQALSYVDQNAMICSPSKAHQVSSACADQLCDEILDHMLDCDLCLNGNEQSCCVYQQSQNQLALAGRPQKGIVFAF